MTQKVTADFYKVVLTVQIITGSHGDRQRENKQHKTNVYLEHFLHHDRSLKTNSEYPTKRSKSCLATAQPQPSLDQSA